MRTKLFAVGVVLAVILGGIIIWRTNGNGNGETVTASLRDLVKTVELAGKVIPEDEADLAFEVVGTVAVANKRVGDRISAGEVIAELDSTKVRADLAKARADLEAAKAELAKLEGGSGLLAEISNSKKSLVQDIMDAYTDADDAIHNKIDQFFTDGTSRNPEILLYFDDDNNIREKINENRIYMEDVLSAWKKDVAGLSAETYTPENLARAKANLDSIVSFLNLVAGAVNAFETNDGLTQTTIDKYRADFATARQNVNSARASLISGEKALTADLSDVPVQAARVAAAEANAANYAATLSKMSLRSPISGVISKLDAKKGEAVSANSPVAGVISAGYKVEAYVPEVSFAGMARGNKAGITLDAYGDDVKFTGSVTHIDPRETIRDGVSTYKIEIGFDSADERIRSGMTSNLRIETSRKKSALSIPLRAVKNDGGEKRVLVKGTDGKEEREVKTGVTDSEGNVEILSGLSDGEAVYLNPIK